MERLSEIEHENRLETTGAARRQTRTLVLRLMCDAHGVWHAALSEPSSGDAWYTTCTGLDSVWPMVLLRLSCAEVQDTTAVDGDN